MTGFQRRLMDVEPQLNHREARDLFFALADEELAEPQAKAVRSHLDGCDECRAGWDRYAKTVQLVRKVEREQAPPMMASLVLNRVKRERRFGVRRRDGCEQPDQAAARLRRDALHRLHNVPGIPGHLRKRSRADPPFPED